MCLSLIPNIFSKTTDLRNLLQKDKRHLRIVNHYKILKTQCVNLAYFDPNKITIIQVATLIGLGTAVVQEENQFASKNELILNRDM